ncbi:site-specific integrase [Tardiphaga sp.]|uniref:tyrosine-type recombinase/integrase n=1 Tax=Tardiphaga sp. TaxID=1926292 RepID=UPI0026026D7F|nr:site-specific integrase [Tardiphaga sp.]
MKLTALAVGRATKRGLHGDGGGLVLQVAKGGSRSWIFRYRFLGKIRCMGLGPVSDVGLSEARNLAATCRQQLRAGEDPIAAKAAKTAAARLELARVVTFDTVAAAYVEAHRTGWRGGKSCEQWTNTLAAHVSPVFGSLPVGVIDTSLVIRALEPIWSKTPTTAGRIRGRIEAILEFAKARGNRDGENPARWRGHLENLFAANGPAAAKQHHAAMQYVEVGDLLGKLSKRDESPAAALSFLVLTACRSGEAIGARWDEIDQERKMWTVPAARMKAGREHRVPLSGAAIDVLDRMRALRQGDFIFPGLKPNTPCVASGMTKLLRNGLKIEFATIHGFRSTFRDWAAEQTNTPPEIADAALAHVVQNKTSAAYLRSDLFDKRRFLMDEWARYCFAAPADTAKVIPMRQAE